MSGFNYIIKLKDLLNKDKKSNKENSRD
jgi:hypothetical protein